MEALPRLADCQDDRIFGLIRESESPDIPATETPRRSVQMVGILGTDWDRDFPVSRTRIGQLPALWFGVSNPRVVTSRGETSAHRTPLIVLM